MPRRMNYLLLFLLLAAASMAAQELVFQLDTAQSHVDFTLGDVLHTVHGKFQLKNGVLHFDRSTGNATGELILDANSGDSDSNARDKKMKRDVLETNKYPTIVFTPQKVTGMLAPNGGSQMQMQGIMSLHGQQHAMTLVVPVVVNGSSASADVHFVVPYVEWGLKDPSTLFLRVSKTVDIDVHAVGTLTTQAAAVSPTH
ncbi:MAG TPA: YceI family protein [Terriglobales bacterium]|nr:YceI family protein [Terriglobales bacterium]